MVFILKDIRIFPFQANTYPYYNNSKLLNATDCFFLISNIAKTFHCSYKHLAQNLRKKLNRIQWSHAIFIYTINILQKTLKNNKINKPCPNYNQCFFKRYFRHYYCYYIYNYYIYSFNAHQQLRMFLYKIYYRDFTKLGHRPTKLSSI